MNDEKVWILKIECGDCGTHFKAFSNMLYWMCPKCKTRHNNNYDEKEWQGIKESTQGD